MKRFLIWLGRKLSRGRSAPADLRETGRRLVADRSRQQPAKTPPRRPELVNPSEDLASAIEDDGAGKNALIRNRFVREDSGTHDNLKILDDSMLETKEDKGFDPYNTGRFDRSKSWNSITRK